MTLTDRAELLVLVVTGIITAMVKFLVAFAPFILGGTVFFILFHNARKSRQLMKRVATEFPEIENPANRVEAIMKGVQRTIK